MKTFENLGVSSELIKAINLKGVTEPTDIQIKAIPEIRSGSNVLAQSETGTGKTLAYVLPIIEMINEDKRENQCIILSPTHELAVQINTTIRELCADSDKKVKTTALIGSANIKRQMEKLKEKPQILVGSPGRILELMQKGKITANTINTVIFDEGDVLLNKNNIDIVEKIIKSARNIKQFTLFSATVNDETKKLYKKIAGEYNFVSAKKTTTVNENIVHYYCVCEQRDKVDMLRKIIHAEKPERALVFINRNYDVNMTMEKLRFNKIKAGSIHGSSFKSSRQKAIEDFKKGKIQVLVASDIAARGLDIQDISHIINLDIPEDFDAYLHRSGRTARAGKTGYSISVVTEIEENKIRAMENKLHIKIAKKFVYMGKIVDSIPKKKVKKDKYAALSKKNKNK